MRNFIISFGFSLAVVLAQNSEAKLMDANVSSFPSKSAKNKSADELDQTYDNLKTIAIDVKNDEISHLILSGQFPVLTSIEIEGGSTSFTGDFTGLFPKMTSLEVSSTSGKIRLDLTGKWKKTLQADIRATSGDIRLTLPENIGVKVSVKKTSGKIYNKSGSLNSAFNLWENTFKNALYKADDVHLDISIEVTSGNVYLN